MFKVMVLICELIHEYGVFLIIGRLGSVLGLSWPYGPHVLGNGQPVLGNWHHLCTQFMNTGLFFL